MNVLPCPSMLSDPDAPFMGFHNMFGNRQTQAGPTAGSGFVDAVKALEDARDVFGRDADPRIPDGESDFAGCCFRKKKDLSTRARELDRVVDEVNEHLLHPLHIHLYFWQILRAFHAQLQAGALGLQ